MFDVIVIAAIALLSSCLLRDQNGFHPVVHGTKEVSRIVRPSGASDCSPDSSPLASVSAS